MNSTWNTLYNLNTIKVKVYVDAMILTCMAYQSLILIIMFYFLTLNIMNQDDMKYLFKSCSVSLY